VAFDGIPLCHAAARFDRGDVNARDIDIGFDRDIGLREVLVGLFLVAPL
jgi:hypothetical protein